MLTARARTPRPPPAIGRPRGRTEHVEPLAALLQRVIELRGLVEVVRHHRVLIEWNQLVGDRIAAATAPDTLSRSVLGVWVRTSSWIHELQFSRHAMIARINDGIGGRPLITDIRFHYGGKDLVRVADRDQHLRDLERTQRRRHPAPLPLRDPTPAAPAARALIAAEAGTIEDPELRALVESVRARWDR